MDINKIIQKFLLSKESDEERSLLEEWKMESAENLRELEAIQAHWAQFGELKGYHNYDEKKAWDNVNSKLIGQPPSLLNLWIRVAAVFALFVGTVYLMKTSLKTDVPVIQTLTSTDSVLEHEFSDKSKIWLNTYTKIDISDFEVDKRSVELLEGEVYFDISPDKEHPFTIALGDKLVTVLGTEFNIHKSNDSFELHVAEGRVSVTGLGREVRVNAGESLLVDSVSMTKVNATESNVWAWKTNILQFKNANISDLVKDLSDYYRVSFKIKSGLANADCLINTTFTNETIDEVIDELKTVYGFRFDINDNIFEIVDIKC